MDVRCLGVTVLAALLVACGGGGGSANGNGSAGASVQLPTGPKTYVAATPSVGDYYSYKQVWQVSGQGDWTEYVTRLVAAVATDGGATLKYVSAIGGQSELMEYRSQTSTEDYDSLGRLLSIKDFSCVQTANPPYHLVALRTISAGMNWQHAGAFDTNCGAGPVQSTLEFKDTVGALEPVSVPAGTFNAFKVTRSSTSINETWTSVRERTCWWEPELGVEVKCLTNMVRTKKATGEKTNYADSFELQSFSNRKLGRKMESALRFTGSWSGLLLGDAYGKCTAMFHPDGTIKGSCADRGFEFDIIGKVNPDGTLALNLVSNGVIGQTITAKFESQQQISGTWSVPNQGSGTWLITQD
ncbi:hypothetical protein [Duganella sp. Root198D2]|uniref:hypothetical protein n=1 Tax=Duganella sp. Root198D2 TaxID=1736489 RepID=UPI000A46DD2E|nr:hypothetical protein [Duganella sp. Root198D2]